MFLCIIKKFFGWFLFGCLGDFWFISFLDIYKSGDFYSKLKIVVYAPHCFYGQRLRGKLLKSSIVALVRKPKDKIINCCFSRLLDLMVNSMKNTVKYASIIVALLLIMGTGTGILAPCQAQTTPVSVSFKTTSLDTFYGTTLIINGTNYAKGGVTFQNVAPGTTYEVTALTPLTAGWYNAPEYRFTGWTNGGDGLTESTGVFVTPTTDTVVTANYEKISKVDIQFSFSGLAYDEYALIIDGEYYTKNYIPADKVYWEPGTAHTITALSPLTATWVGAPVHRFLGWTNGNGLVGETSIFITPDSATTVTANYIVSSEPLATNVTIKCTPTVVDKYGDATTTITGTLSSESVSVIREVELSYFDGLEWIAISKVTPTSSGAYAYAWIVPESIANGQYAIKAEFPGDSTFNACEATAMGDSGLFVVPEYAWGGLSVLLVCFAAFLVVKLRRKQSRQPKP